MISNHYIYKKKYMYLRNDASKMVIQYNPGLET